MIPKDKETVKFIKMVCKHYKSLAKDGSMFPYITMTEYDTIPNLLRRIHENGFFAGIKQGKEEKSHEIRVALGIEEEYG